MKLLKRVPSLSLAATALMLSAGNVLAQGDSAPPFTPPNSTSAGFKIEDLGAIIQGVMNVVMFVAALLVFGYMVWGGVQWITSGGDKGKTEEARNKITSAIIGLAVVAASYAIFRLVLFFLGIDNPLDGTVTPIPSILDIQGKK